MKNHNQVIFDQTEPIYVWADEFMIEEVFSNYFSNALHHVAPGGEIRVWIEKRAGDIRVHVFNEGSQIPEEDLEKLWIKFYKVDKARTREYGGSGVGLSIVRAIMEQHGQSCQARNCPDGVEFSFTLESKTGL
jgi:signal transduction histidine kinase